MTPSKLSKCNNLTKKKALYCDNFRARVCVDRVAQLDKNDGVSKDGGHQRGQDRPVHGEEAEARERTLCFYLVNEPLGHPPLRSIAVLYSIPKINLTLVL